MDDDPKERKGQASPEDDEAPAIYSIDHADDEPMLTRRTFLDIAAMAAGTGAVASGCMPRIVRPAPKPTPEPKPASPNIGSAHKSGVTALAVDSAGRLLASGDKDGTIKLWQLPEGILLQSWSAHESAIADLSFPQASDTLWSLDSTGALEHWHLPDGVATQDRRPVTQVGGAAFAVPGAADWYAVPAGRAVEIRNQLTGERLHSLEGLEDDVKDLAAVPDGRLLVAGGASGKVGVWTEPAGAHPPTVKLADTGSVNALAIAPNGAMALSAHASSHLEVWPLPGMGSPQQQESAFGEPHCVAIRPQQDLFVVGSQKPDIGVWKLDAMDTAPQSLTGHTAPVRAVAITPDGSLLISGGDDKTIRLWSLPDCQYLRVLVDLESNTKNVDGTTYQGTDIYGRHILFTLPCGSPIPPGAVCVCNCVPGSLAIPTNFTQNYNTQGICTCDTICTCNTVCTCQSICTCQSVGGRYVTYWYPN